MNSVITDAAESRNRQAQAQAMAEMEKQAIDPTGLIVYRSGGRIAIIGDNLAMEIATRFQDILQPLVILTAGAEEPGVEVIPLGQRPLRLSGHLGAFELQLGDAGKPNHESVSVDLVLDLGAQPLLDRPLPPPGYVHSSTEETALDEAIESLAGLKGTFEKPTYFDYDASICAHGRSGIQACNRCIDACPAGAITSLVESIEVDPYLCQGGGVCSTVCPSGAIRYAYPKPADALSRLRVLLQVYRQQGGQRPVVAFIKEAGAESLANLPGHFLPFVVEELASVGLEIWLATLAFGADSLVLVDDGSEPEEVMKALVGQVDTTGEILDALGYPSDAVSIIHREALPAASLSQMPEIHPAGFSGVGGKRQTAFLAIDHLFEQSYHPKPLANLTVGAPFGAAFVEPSACTLCFSCVGACPGKALQAGEGEPRLEFIEANCIQCGLCTRTCPEDAIWITPRLLFDRAKRTQKRVLHEEEPFLCSSCGKPFATRSVIEKMQQRLQGHWMFQNNRAKKRLTLCEDCRVVDIVQDQDAMESAQNGPTRQ